MPELHPHLLNDIANLPAQTGVYRFYRDATLLYVGKSINLRQRVQAHVSAAKRKGKEARYVFTANRLQHEVCSTELHALLRESALIKEYRPHYNKRLRRARRLWSWHLDVPAPSSLPVPKLVSHQWPPPPRVLQWGLFRHRKQALDALRQLCREEQLCEQTLGISKGSGPCFHFQIKRCRGACAGVETITQHWQRTHEALARRAHNLWPFSGAIAVCHDQQDAQVSVLDAWNYLGDFPSITAARATLLAAQTRNTAPSLQLDLDAFRIVVRYLRTHAVQTGRWQLL